MRRNYAEKIKTLDELVAAIGRRPRRKKVIISEAIHPEYRAVAETYLKNSGITLETLPFNTSGQTALDSLKIDDQTAAVFIQSISIARRRTRRERCPSTHCAGRDWSSRRSRRKRGNRSRSSTPAS